MSEHDALIVLADTVLVVHVAFVGFVVLGQAYIMAGWAFRWPSARNRIFRVFHLIAIGVVVLQAWLGLMCPLTLLEYHLREGPGGWGSNPSFVGYWLSRLLYYEAPAWVFTVVYTLFGALVAGCYFGYPPNSRR